MATVYALVVAANPQLARRGRLTAHRLYNAVSRSQAWLPGAEETRVDLRAAIALSALLTISERSALENGHLPLLCDTWSAARVSRSSKIITDTFSKYK